MAVRKIHCFRVSPLLRVLRMDEQFSRWIVRRFVKPAPIQCAHTYVYCLSLAQNCLAVRKTSAYPVRVYLCVLFVACAPVLRTDKQFVTKGVFLNSYISKSKHFYCLKLWDMIVYSMYFHNTMKTQNRKFDPKTTVWRFVKATTICKLSTGAYAGIFKGIQAKKFKIKILCTKFFNGRRSSQNVAERKGKVEP